MSVSDVEIASSGTESPPPTKVPADAGGNDPIPRIVDSGSSPGASAVGAWGAAAIIMLLVFSSRLLVLTYLYVGPTSHFTKPDSRVRSIAALPSDSGLDAGDILKSLTGFLAAVATLRIGAGAARNARVVRKTCWGLLILALGLAAFWSEGMQYFVVRTAEFGDELYDQIQHFASTRLRETLILVGTLASGVVGKD